MSTSSVVAADKPKSMRTVLCSEGLYEPTEGILRYLDIYPATRADPVRVLFGVRRTPIPAQLVEDPNVHLATFIPGRALRRANVQYLRYSYSQVCRRIADGTLQLHGVVACSGSADRYGIRSLCVVNGYLSLALAAARVVVVEEWPEMVSIGGSAIASRVDHVVPWAGPDRFIALSSEPDNVTELMAGHVSALIPQHATVALGVGKIADSIARQCISRRGLSITTGAITESVMYLDQAGALDPTAAINGMSVIGDSELVAWAADHPRVRLRSSTYVHEPSWLAMRDRFVVVLGALNLWFWGHSILMPGETSIARTRVAR